MCRALLSGVGCALCVAALVRAQGPQTTFRTGVDLIQVDVSVLDRDRHPVRGLTAADFTLLEDGKPRPIVSFAAVDIPAPSAPPARWMADVAPDVATNTHPAGRVVVIVIDDGALASGGVLWGLQKARAAARAAVSELGPDDLAAVVFTEHPRTAQNFTTDRGRLLAAIENAPLFPAPTRDGGSDNVRGSCLCGLCSIEGLQRVAEGLRSVQQQRKTILYVSPGIKIDVTMPEFERLPSPYSTFNDTCEISKHLALLDVFRQAALANVTISAIDPNGILGIGGGHSHAEFLKTIAENTGGRAVTDNNDPEREVPAILLESSSYYLLGFESAAPGADGAFHRVQVRVNGRDVQVRARSGYFAPTPKELKATAAKGAAPGSLEAAIGGQLPKSDLPMQVSVAPFADGNRKAALAVALGVTQPANADKGESPAPGSVTTTVDVFAGAFDSEGKSWGSRRLTARVGGRNYELLPRLPIPPGRYELRLAVRTADGRSGSVYTFVDVPDFARDGLSLSGIVLGALPAPAAAPGDAYKDLLPLVPTARREFAPTDRVTAFLRVYQGGSHALVPVTMTTRLIDDHDKQMSETTRQLDVTSFSNARSFDDRFDLPVRILPPGEYLLRVHVAAGAKSSERALRFRVR